MRWVTYLSPSGGEQRPGVVDDGCVFGYPGPEDLPQLLAKGTAALREAHRQALAEPVEIIVEFETRLCAPLVPERPLTVSAWRRTRSPSTRRWCAARMTACCFPRGPVCWTPKW